MTDILEPQVEEQVIDEGQPIEGTDAPAKVEGATLVDEQKIALFKEVVGEIPKGFEIVMHNGKPHIVGRIDGKPVAKTLDSVIRDMSMYDAGEAKLNAGKDYEKKAKEAFGSAQSLVKTLIEDPDQFWEVLQASGMPEEKIAEIAAKRLEKAIKDAETPKEVRELEQTRRELEALKKQNQEREEKENKEKLSKEVEAQYKTQQTEVFKALQENKVFDESVPENIKAQLAYSAVYWLKNAEDQGIKDFTADKAVKKAMKDLEGWGKSYYSALSDEMLVKMLPEKVAKVYAQTIKRSAPPTANSLNGIGEGQGKTEKKKMSINEAFSKI